jgi:hypothetical protein
MKAALALACALAVGVGVAVALSPRRRAVAPDPMPARSGGDAPDGAVASRPRRLPLWVKIAVSALVAVLVPVYWHEYGPDNFLWFSDLALLLGLVALWREDALLASMTSVGALALEIAWTVDFLAGGRLLQLAAYMYDDALPLHLRAMSLFHLVVPPMLILMLVRLGYDRRALRYQTAFAWVVLAVTWLLTDPAENINWVFGWGKEPQQIMPPVVYLGLVMLVLPLLVFVPSHAVLKRLFGPPPA